MTAVASEKVVVPEAVKMVEGKELEAANAAPECDGVPQERDVGEAKDDAEASYVFVNGVSDDFDADPAAPPTSAEDFADPAAGEGVVQPEKPIDVEVLAEVGKEVTASAEVEADQDSKIVVPEVVEPEKSSVSDDVLRSEPAFATGTESEVKSFDPVTMNGGLESSGLDDTNVEGEIVIAHSGEEETETKNSADADIEVVITHPEEEETETKNLADADIGAVITHPEEVETETQNLANAITHPEDEETETKNLADADIGAVITHLEEEKTETKNLANADIEVVITHPEEEETETKILANAVIADPEEEETETKNLANADIEVVITHPDEETETKNLASADVEAVGSTEEQGLKCKELGDTKLDEIVSLESKEVETKEFCHTKLEAEIANGSLGNHVLETTDNGDSKLEAEIPNDSHANQEVELSKLEEVLSQCESTDGPVNGEGELPLCDVDDTSAVVNSSDVCDKPEGIEMEAGLHNGAIVKDSSVEVQELMNRSYENKSLVSASPPNQDVSSEIGSEKVVLGDEVSNDLDKFPRSLFINPANMESEIEVENSFAEINCQPEAVTEDMSSPAHALKISEMNHEDSSCLLLCPEDESKPGSAVNNGSVENVEGLPIHTSDVVEFQPEEGSKYNDELASAVAPADYSLENSRSLPINSSGKIELECEQGNKSHIADTVDSVPEVDVRKETLESGEDGSTGYVDDVKLDSDASTISFVENVELSSNKEDGDKIGCEEVEDKLAGSSYAGEPKKKTPIFILKMPRCVEDELRERIRLAQVEVDQKTQDRDVVRVAMQKQKAICNECKDKVAAAKVEENAARDAFSAKKRDLDSVQAMMNKLKNATSIEEIDERICGMERKIQHETMALKDEKQLIREIKQMKQAREQLCASVGSQSEFQEVFEQKENIEARMKHLKTELDSLRVELVRSEDASKAVKRKQYEEIESLKKLQSQYKDVDSLRQQAYAEFKSLKKEMAEKSKHFYQYKEDQKVAANLESAGDSKALLRFHDDQMAKLQLYAKDDQFRRDYVKYNMVSTIRRLRTLDGTALGPDEEPQALPPPRVIAERTDASSRVTTPVVVNAESTSQLSDAPVTPEKNERKAIGALGPKDPPAKQKKAGNPASLVVGPTAVSSRVEEAEEELKERKLSKEEEELKRKEEERARKEEERQREGAAAKLKEQRRLEEITKAKDAEERKRRNAEKAQARAEFKAKKEMELKEREREKRARKKERKRGIQGDVSGENDETESNEVAQQNSPAEPAQEPEVKEKPVTTVRRYSKSAAVKKVALPPLPLRNRGKRRIQAWMWWALLAVVLVTVVLVASNAFFGFGRSKFGF